MNRYLLSVAICLVGYMFTFPLAPLWAFVVALFKIKYLPLISTTDDDVYGTRYRAEHLGEKEEIPETFGKRFTTACWWIWRNPNYDFNSRVLGLPVEGTTVTITGSFEKFDTGENELMEATFTNPKFPEDYFSYRRDLNLSGKRFVKMWFGWQTNSLDGKHYMLKFMFNPFRTAR